MWRKCLAALALLLVPTPAPAASVNEPECELRGAESICELRVIGEVMPGDRLFIPHPGDSDQLFFEGKVIALTTNKNHAMSFLPRTYNLGVVEGKSDVVLTLKSNHLFPPDTAPGMQAKIIPQDFPLRKIYFNLVRQCLALLALLFTASFLLTHLQHKSLDGWTYPRDELRWFFSGLICFLALSSELSHLAVPSVWSYHLHEFCRGTSLAITIWALTNLLLEARFNDRSCVERGVYRRRGFSTAWIPDGIFLTSVLAALPPLSIKPSVMILIQAVPLTFALVLSARSLEWKRVLKRSAGTPLLFHFSLLCAAASLIAFAPLFAFDWISHSGFLVYLGAVVLALGALRVRWFLRIQERARSLAIECRQILLRFGHGNQRLQALCEFIEDEWGAARVSMISVEGQSGLVLASAGPDAIPDSQRSGAKRLGPFLKRVCRAGHLLYAPVAEELGKDLQDKGMKHSSLALPFHQQGRIRGVLCVMADEGERIPPADATALDLLGHELYLEVLSAVAQNVAEEKCERLLAIARRADGIAVEHIDDWGHLQYADKEEERVLLGAELSGESYLPVSPALRKAQREFNRELKSIWQALAQAFEFVPKDLKEDFWILSPKEFRHPCLKKLGSEGAALALAVAMDRQARALAAREGYLLLGQPGIHIAFGKIKLRLVGGGQGEEGAMDVDARDQEALRRLREKVTSGPTYWGSAPAEHPEYRCLFVPAGNEYGRDFSSILGMVTDKRELRKIEARALESVKDILKRSA